jgi:hypothetical protein
MKMDYESDGNVTRILIRPEFTNGQKSISGFTGAFVTVGGEMVSMEMATIMGQPVAAKLAPKSYAL